MNKKSIFKALVAIAIALVFVMPVAAVANDGTIGVTSDSEITNDMENIVETSVNSDSNDNIETDSDDEPIEDPFIEPTIEDPVIDAEELSIVNDASSVVSSGTIWYVGSGLGNDSTTIQGGIDLANASGGDTVYVYDGTYNEKITIGKQLDLIGESQNVIVNGGGSGKVVTVTVNDVNISTFSITKGQYGIYLSGSSSNIINCKVYNNYASAAGYGIYLSGSSGNEITNCEVYDNHKSGYSGFGYGIYLMSSSGNEITNCDVYHNYGVTGYGIYIKSSSDNKITGCDVHHQEGIGWYGASAVGIYLTGSSNIDIVNCNLYENRPPKVNSYGVQGTSSNNINITNCEIYNNGCFGIQITQSPSIIIRNCNVHDNNNGVYPVTLGTGISLGSTNGKIINTTSSYQGVGIYVSGDNMVVDGCTVYENNQGIRVYGSANSGSIVTNCHVYNNLRGGSSGDGGIEIISSLTTVANCIIHDNFGPGISMWHRESSGNIVTNCEIYNNTGDGDRYHGRGIFLRGRSQTITNCNISNNEEGGIYSDCYNAYETSDNSIIGCNIYDNDPYGIYFEEVSNCVISTCDVYNNDYGIYIYNSLNCKLRSNTMHGNTGNFGIDGWSIDHFHHNIDASNSIDGRPIYYFIDEEDIDLDETDNFGFLGMISCTRMTAKNSDVIGVFIVNTTDSTLSNLNAHNSKIGTYIWMSSNCDITDCDVYDNKEQGIYLEDSSGINITNCNLYGNGQQGIYLEDSLDIKLRGNTFSDNVYSFDVSGTTVDHYTHDIDESNMIIDEASVFDGKIIYYLTEQGNLTLNETHNIGYLAMISCWNITAENLDVTGVLVINTTDATLLNIDSHDTPINCIYVWMSPDCTITDCSAYNAYYGNAGIYVLDSSSIDITNCNAYDNGRGIYLVISPNSVVTNCSTDNTNTTYFQNRGIYLSGGSDNGSVVNCSISNSRYGVGIYETSDCTIIGCTISDTDFGIQVSSYSHNNIIMDCDVSRSKYQSVVVRGRRSTERNINNAIINCSMHDNTGVTYTLYLRYTDYTNITNCTVYNSPREGILLDSDNYYVTIMGCSIYNNAAQGIYTKGKNYYNNIINCDIHDNTKDGLYILIDTAIENCEIYNNGQYGIYLSGATGSSIIDCNVFNNKYGIYIYIASGCYLTGNHIDNNNVYDFRVAAKSYNPDINHFYHDIDKTNTINTKPIYYLVGNKNETIDETTIFSYLILISCDNMTLRNLDFGSDLMIIRTTNSMFSNVDVHGGKYGFWLWESSDNDFIQCSAYSNTESGFYLTPGSTGNNIMLCDIYSNSKYGVYLYGASSYNSIMDCTIHNNNKYGIYIYYKSSAPSYCVIERCDIYDNSNSGIYTRGSSGARMVKYNTIKDCKIHGSSYGIYFYNYEQYNTIVDCIFYDNNYGIYYKGTYTKYNEVYHNTFAYNNINAYNYRTTVNYWDNGYSDPYNATTDGGNYWDDYTGVDLKHGVNQDINGSDGIGDTAYVSGKVTDNYPLMDQDDLRALDISVVGSGTTDPAAGGVHSYLNGTVVDLEAFSGSGWEFTAWSGDITTTDNPTTITMDSDKAVTATFTQLSCNLTISVVGSGTTDPAAGVHSYLSGTVVDLEAFSGSGWEFTAWSGDISTTDNPTIITMDSDKAVTATFIDVAPPEITGVTMTTSDPLDTEPGFGWENITCTVTDNLAVDEVKLDVTNPNMTTVEYIMTKIGDTYYCNTTLTDAGDYTYHIWANDTSDNSVESTPEQTFLLPENWDMNDDRFCDISDLRKVALQFGEIGPYGWIRADYNNDGICDISDLRKVALHFGATY